MSFLIKCQSTYFYLYKDKNYVGVTPSGAVAFPANNQFIPIKFVFTVDGTV